ncbi:MAG: hypothetical protein ACYSWZ_19825 [Planctomycetota bacterium]|jgi:hypothetical protein
MSRKKDEKWLDELISQTIDSGKPEFDAERWKQKYPEEFQMLQSMSKQDSSTHQPSIWRIVRQSPITKIAAVAVIIVAIGLIAVFVHRGPDEQIGSGNGQSPTKMMSAMSLTMAYRRGGIEAVDKQYEKAIRMLGPKPVGLTVKQLLKKTNG